jgi:hypothetical protein
MWPLPASQSGGQVHIPPGTNDGDERRTKEATRNSSVTVGPLSNNFAVITLSKLPMTGIPFERRSTLIYSERAHYFARDSETPIFLRKTPLTHCETEINEYWLWRTLTFPPNQIWHTRSQRALPQSSCRYARQIISKKYSCFTTAWVSGFYQLCRRLHRGRKSNRARYR